MKCKNCQLEIDSSNRYCQNCGARIPRNRLTLKNLFQHLNETFLNFDNKFIQTILHLIKNPIVVIDGYVNGVRKKFMGPLELFAVILTISGVYILIVQKFFPNAMDFSGMYEMEAQKKFSKASMNLVMEYNSFLYFLYIPIASILSWVVFLDKRYNFTEHLVIYFYTLSLFSLISILYTLVVLEIAPNYYLQFSVVLYVLFFIYQCRIYINLFFLNFKQLILRILIFLPLLGISYIMFSIFLVIMVVLLTDFSFQEFLPPSRK